MKHFLTTLTVLSLLSAPAAYTAEKSDSYISDNLYIYLHSGPGTQYRIIGSVDAGTKISILEDRKEKGYTQIIDDRGRKGWIESKFISYQQSLKLLVPSLNEELTKVKAALANATSDSAAKTQGLVESLEIRNTQLKELETRTTELNQKLIDSETEIRELRAQIDTQKDDLLMRWFTYGGMVAGAGLLFGLIMPHIIPRRKKRNSSWK